MENKQPAGCDLDSLQRYYVGEMGAYPMQTGEYVKFADVQAAARTAQAPQGDTRQGAPADQVKHGDMPSIEITLRQAKELVDCFGGYDAEISIIQRLAAWSDMPDGLYAYFSEYPDEGSMYLGPTEVDDDLATNGEPDETRAAHTCTPADERAPTCSPNCFWGDCPPCVEARAAQGAGTAPVGAEVREFAEAVASPKFTYVDRETDWTCCSGCNCPEVSRGAFESPEEAHKEGCIVLRARAWLATHPAPVSTAAATTASASDLATRLRKRADSWYQFVTVDRADLIAAADALASRAADGQQGASRAALDVLAERRRQVEVEGWHPDQDDDYEDGQLSIAAACYAMQGNTPNYGPPADWPWDREWWKPADDRRNLVKAGALILADIERIDRVALAAKRGGASD